MLCDDVVGGSERGGVRSQTPMSGLLVSLLATIAVTAHKLIDTSCRIDELGLARVERVRGVRNLYLNKGIGLTINLDSLLSVCCTLRDEDFVI